MASLKVTECQWQWNLQQLGHRVAPQTAMSYYLKHGEVVCNGSLPVRVLTGRLPHTSLELILKKT